jgi:Folate-dependent phosphoribosylglycinamide formyltransferase PurN
MPDKTIQQTPPRSWPQGQRRRLAVLISGRGSNLQALHQSAQAYGFALDWLIVANRKDSKGLIWARDHGLETELLLHSDFASREEFDRQLAYRLNRFEPHLIVLAGFMRILTDVFLAHFMALQSISILLYCLPIPGCRPMPGPSKMVLLCMGQLCTV